jgi:hypothetical protein
MVRYIHRTIVLGMSIFVVILVSAVAQPEEVMACDERYEQCGLPVEPGSITSATIVAIKGDVTIMNPITGISYPASLNDKLYPGYIVETGNMGRVQIVYPDDTILSVGRGTMITLDPKSFVDSSGGKHKISVIEGAFRVVGGAITKMGEDKKERVTPTAVLGIRGTTYLFTEDPVAGWAEYSVLDGLVEIDGIGWDALPDEYFTDPTNKNIETIDLARVYQDVTDETSFVDVIGIGAPLLLEAGYWTHIDSGQPPTPPQAGIAPSQRDFVYYVTPCNVPVSIPEPSTMLLLGAGVVVLIGMKKFINNDRARIQSHTKDA